MLLRRTGEQPLSFTQNMRLSLSPNMGLSLGLPLPPWDWRRWVRLPTHEIRPDGCTIKGNINPKGRRIYHVPGSASYGQTIIDESKGERWFCSDDEARAAGWVKP